ncbi:MAG: hypothetical protein HQL13_06975 [Candidatus Omnitrophica bacterium]|nr:hypothetical protein [Candidatus Omnitrophota bacterium]
MIRKCSINLQKKKGTKKGTGPCFSRALSPSSIVSKFLVISVLLSFISTTIVPVPVVHAKDFILPKPGVMVSLSQPLNPPILKGIKVHPDNPFQFDFILDKGDSTSLVRKGTGPCILRVLSPSELKQEATKLIKYFLASITIPEKDLWVNLSPYEKDRIIPKSFGLTEMGRDLLAEDYMLKQITASLIYPEDEVGKRFWKRIYEEAAKRYGTTDVPVNTFNKVWIVPEKAVVYENAKVGAAYVVESKLKVMLEQDYLSLEKHTGIQSYHGRDALNRFDVASIGANIVREIIIPQLTTEVNKNKNFASLRQVYNSLILATWYKKKIKDSILSEVYADKNKVAGVNIDDAGEKQRIYQKYLKAFKKGVFNYIKEDLDTVTQEVMPRKYFSGGVALEWKNWAMLTVHQLPNRTEISTGNGFIVESSLNQAMLTKDEVLAVMEANNWRFGDENVKNILGLSATQDFYQYFEQMGFLPELKKKLQESLERNNGAIKAVAREFGTNSPTITKLNQKLFLVFSRISPERAREILVECQWKFGLVKKQLGIRNAQNYFEFFKDLGLLEELKPWLKESLDRNGWSLVKVGEEFGVSPETIQFLISQYPLVREEKKRSEVLRILEDNQWRLDKVRDQLGITRTEGYYKFFERLGLLTEFKQKLQESLERNHRILGKVVDDFGVPLPTIRGFMKQFSLVHKVDKQEAKQILDNNGWRIGDVKSVLGIGPNQDYYVFFQGLGLLEDLKIRLQASLASNGWSVTSSAEQFNISVNGIHSLVKQFLLVEPRMSKEEILAILEDHDWRLGEVKDKLGLHATENYYHFFEQSNLLPEARAKLKEALDASNWTEGTVANRFNTTAVVIASLIDRFSLFRENMDKGKVLEMLNDNDWKFGAIKHQLGIKNGQSYYDFFQQLGLLDELKSKLEESLTKNKWVIIHVANEFGVTADAVQSLKKSLSLVRVLDKSSALEMLKANGWRFGDLKEELGMRYNRQSYYDVFSNLGLLEELKAELEESLSKNGWRIYKVAEQFGVSDNSIDTLIQKFDLVRQDRNIQSRKIHAIVSEQIQKIFLDNLGALSTRYLLDIKTLLWGLVGYQLRGEYDEEMVKKIIDYQLGASY